MFSNTKRSRRWQKSQYRFGRQNLDSNGRLKNGKEAGPKRTTSFKRKSNYLKMKIIEKNPPLLFDWENIDEKTIEKFQEKIESGQLNPEKDMRRESEVLSPLSKTNVRKKTPTKSSYQDKNFITLEVSSWNVERKGSPEEIDKLLIDKVKNPDVVCLQEANFPTSLDSTENFKWLTNGTCGSAILINKALSKVEVCSTESVCEQIFFADLMLENSTKIRVISCQIPPSTNYLCKELWMKLEKVLKEIPSNIKFVLGGDFNAQIGKDNVVKDVCKSSVGYFLHHEKSDENGLSLVNLAIKGHLRIVNTWGSLESKITYTFKNGDSKTQPDFFLIQPFGSLQAYFSSRNNVHWVPDYRHAILGCSVRVYKTQPVKEEQELKPTAVSTWNIQGANPSKIDTILNEQDLLVVCVQELFITSDNDLQTEHYDWHYSGKHWAKSVGIAVKKSPNVQLTKFESVSDCLCIADIQLYDKPIKVISCFVPPPEDSRNESVKSDLLKITQNVPLGMFFFVAGDFGARFVDGKVPDNKNSNEVFLKNLVEEAYFSLEQNLWDEQLSSTRYLISQVTATQNGRPHQILMPVAVKFGRERRVRICFIPFFENAIVTLFVEENVRKEKEGTKSSVKYEMKDGLIYRTKTIEYTELKEFDEACIISPEDKEKFKDSQPLSDDLARLFNDFVILNTVDVRKCHANAILSAYALTVLIASFKEGKKFGSFFIEEVEAGSCFNYVSPSMKLKWQGTVLEERKSDKKSSFNSEESYWYQRKIAESFFQKLGSFCYMIKDKKSYYNRGHEPALMKDPQFKDVIKVYGKADCPTMPEVLKHIENFFTEDTDCELAFGPDFPKEELDAIEKFAKENNLNHRYFKLAANPENTNHIAVFKKRTPQYIRDKILKNGDDPKYYLIPPFESGVEDYKGYMRKYEAENEICKVDGQLCSRFWSIIANVDEKGKGSKVDKKPTPVATVGDIMKTSTPKIIKIIVKEPAERTENVRPPQQQLPKERQPQPRQKPQRKRGVDYDDLSEEFEKWKSPSSYRGSAYQGSSYSNSGQEKQYDADYPLPKRPMLQEQARSLETENLRESLPKRNVPQWNRCDPLIVVWPITYRSQLEDRPTVVLSDNFPTEFPVNRHNYTAAVVTLPMRGGGQRKFCLSVGSDQKRVAREALDLIVKHSTVIKPSPSYLCNGTAPNFIRYNVPCQTNPRTYIILSRRETGVLNKENVSEMLEAFMDSYNEDVFFDRYTYSLVEKNLIISLAQKYKLKFRHFGDSPGIVDRWVCVYKLKPKDQLLEEILKMRGSHPKYTITTDRLPPRMGLNIF